MIKLILSIPLMLWSFCAFTQAPDGYYDLGKDKSGAELKASLHEIIKNHEEFTYNSTSTDTWDILKETDRDTANSENVILFYSGWSVNAEQEYNNGKGWSREHVWAKSHGDFGTTRGAGTDLHHLRPCDISINSARSNKDFDMGGTIYTDGDGITECKSDADSWEPRDEVKGDVARMLFYMAVRYEGEGDEPDLELADQVKSFELNESVYGFHGKFSTLLEWHKADPVDRFEINRNNAIYSYQKNRNPFIDNPEYASLIWLNTDIKERKEARVKIFPNPAKEYIFVELDNLEPAQVKIFSAQGNMLKEFEVSGKVKVSVKDFVSGVYFLWIDQGKDALKTTFMVSK